MKLQMTYATALVLVMLSGSGSIAQTPTKPFTGLSGVLKPAPTENFVALARRAGANRNNIGAVNSAGSNPSGGRINVATGWNVLGLEGVTVSNSYQPQFGCSSQLCLPFAQSLNSGDTGFAIINEGAGDAIHAEAKGGDIGSAVVAINSMGSTAKLAFRGLGAEIRSSVTTAIFAQGATFGIESSGSSIGVQGIHSGSGNFGQLGTGSQGVFGSSSGGVGVQGTHGGTGNFGQLGTSGSGVFGSSNGIGVKGFSSGGNGVRGESPAGFGVRGDSTSGYGVVGFSTSNDGVVGFGRNGVHGQSSSANDSGVWGENLGGGYGVAGTSPNNAGVSGRNSSMNNQGQLGTYYYGAYGSHGSTGNAGYLGGSFFGTYGYSNVGSALYGYSVYGVGVFGTSNSGFGGLAGKFDGNVQVIGNISKSSGSFKIDHPLDPENKYLYHSFVESPEMKNIYDGTVKLDENGEAEVKLPEWFESLNSDFRYLLTAIGAPAPGLYISEEVKDNRFKIAGGTFGLRVSWQVTGIRQDAYARKNRILVEEEKPEIERGFYLHPEAHGQPEEKSVEFARNPEIMKQMKKERVLQPPQQK